MNAIVCFKTSKQGEVIIRHLPTKDLPKQIEQIEKQQNLIHYATYLREKQ